MTAQRTVLLRRLADQFESYGALFGGIAAADLRAHPEDGKWSAWEHLAHLGRYHEVFLERIELLLDGGLPELGRYRAEEDPRFPAWVRLPERELWPKLRARRSSLAAALEDLSSADWDKSGVHPVYGTLTLAQCVHFFLVHEGHHLYAAYRTSGVARVDRESEP